jgi:hypothetical protein
LHDHGECYAEASGEGASCVCEGESEETLVSFAEIAEHADLTDDPCQSALNEHCGPPAPTASCESTNGDAHGRCKQLIDGTYDCACSTGNGDSAGGGYETTDSCETVLARFCPEAFGG